jgi:arsenate reductase
MSAAVSILFVCIENACRSQMAEGFARHYGMELVQAHSAGSHPGQRVNPDAVAVMQEIGIDISKSRPKGFESLPVQKFDYVITMGCMDACPFVPAKRQIEWDIEDPKNKSLYFFRKTRDTIGEKVKQLIRMIVAARAADKPE